MKTLSTLSVGLSLAGSLLAADPAAAQISQEVIAQDPPATVLPRPIVRYRQLPAAALESLGIVESTTPQEPRVQYALPSPVAMQRGGNVVHANAPKQIATDALGRYRITYESGGNPVLLATAVLATSDDEAMKREIETYARTANMLAARGYQAESKRLIEIYLELKAELHPRSIAERATKLLAGDIEDRAVRVPIIELAAEGYELAGWESNAKVLDWFASIGRNQLSDGPTEVVPMPEGASTGSGSVMDNLIEMILGAAGVHKQLGNEEAARACMRLGRFYIERELGAFADREEKVGRPDGPSIDRLRMIEFAEVGADVVGIDAPEPLRELGYGGGVAIDPALRSNEPAEESAEEFHEIQALEVVIERLQAQVAKLEAQLAQTTAEMEARDAEPPAPRRGGQIR